MSREIKFRGKHALGWAYGSLIERSRRYGTQVSILTLTDDEELDDREVVVNNRTVGQFTGLLDKNRVEIYEGDRILYSNSMERGEGVISFDKGFNIEWDLSTVVTNKPSIISPLWYFGCSQEIEVIGDIYSIKQNRDSKATPV